VRICTNRWRCHNSCHRSRFSGLGIQVRGKIFSRISRSSIRGSSRSVLCFLTCFVLITTGSPIHTSKPSSASSRSRQREYPVASNPTRTPILCRRSGSRYPFDSPVQSFSSCRRLRKWAVKETISLRVVIPRSSKVAIFWFVGVWQAGWQATSSPLRWPERNG